MKVLHSACLSLHILALFLSTYFPPLFPLFFSSLYHVPIDTFYIPQFQRVIGQPLFFAMNLSLQAQGRLFSASVFLWYIANFLWSADHKDIEGGIPYTSLQISSTGRFNRISSTSAPSG